MKKIFLIGLIVLSLCGCKKATTTNVAKTFQDDVANTKSYYIEGTMQIIGDEDTFTYSIETTYLKDNNYKVKLVNQTNNHEQIILRNSEGVYVITPSLNKSFKFQSEWPNNSSQSYILEALAKDIKNTKDVKAKEDNNKLIIETTVNYPNNDELTKQRIILDKDAKLKQVEVLDNKGNVKIKLNVNKLDMRYNANKDDFELQNFIEETEENNNDNDSENKTENKEQNTNKAENEQCTDNKCKKTSTLDQAIYPLYIPSETKLTNTEKIETDNGDRVILTFSGEKNFVLVEEPSAVYDEHEIIPVYGDPLMMQDTIAVISDNSIYWTSNNIDYYLTSKDLENTEILSIANSLGNTISVSASK